MITPEKMRKVRIIVMKSIVADFIRLLHEVGVVEIKKTDYANLDAGRPLDFYDVVSEQLVKLRGVSAVLYKYHPKTFSKPVLVQAKEAVHESSNLGMLPKLKILTSELELLGNEISSAENSLKLIRRLLPFKGIDFSRLKTKTVSYMIGECQKEKLAILRNRLGKLSANCNLIVPDAGAGNLFLLVYDKKQDHIIENMLGELGATHLEAPAGMNLPSVMFTKLENELVVKKARIVQINRELTDLAKNNLKKIESLKYSLEVAADRAEITSKFGSSASVMFLTGWVRNKQYPELQNLVANFGSKAHLEESGIGHDESPPVVLDNPSIGSPFEFITKSYSLPNALEIDPTMIYFITLPILYGMIVGDVFYGIMSMLIASWFMKKFQNSYVMSNVSKIWFYSGFPTIFFGIIFDEWFGLGHEAFLNYLGSWFGTTLIHEPLYHGFHRMKEIALLIAVSALVGIIHIAMGLIIGAINQWNHHRKHAYAKIAWLGVELSGFIAVLSLFFGLLPAEIGFGGIGLLLVSIVGLFFTEGIVGVIEIPGLLGNILSYSRIAAIGVVGVIIAELLNEFILPVPSQGLLALILFPIFIALHFVNCFIAMFEALIQGGRLNLIEFKSKFLNGGGSLFAPFSLRSK